MQFERDQTRNGGCAKCGQKPRAHRHGGAMFENAQHVEEEMRTTKIHDQKNWRKDRAGDGRNPHGCARKIDMMKQHPAERNRCRRPADATKEEVERNFPSPDRWFHHRLAVIAGLPRNWATDDVDTATRDNTFLPRLFPQLLEALFGWRIGCHEKTA